MKKLIVLASFALILSFTGCDSAKEEPIAPSGGNGPAAKDSSVSNPTDDAKKPEAGSSKLSEDELAAINKLPESDRALAIAQMTCPVSGDNLGSMEAPLKVTFEGKSAFLCCKGCKKEFEADPAKVLAKIGSKK